MTDHVQPTWAGAPDWANFWAADSDGYAYWYRDEPTYDAKYGGWIRTLGDEPGVSWDIDWAFVQVQPKWSRSGPEGFDSCDIDWDKTLRSRP